jgi:hypothetical protein
MLRNAVAVRGRRPSLFGRGRATIGEELRIDAEYERRVDGLARAADLRRELVQRVEVLEDIVERAFGDVLPFVL